MSLEVTGRQNCCLPLPQLPLWQGGRERQEQLVALAATHSPLTMVWSTTVSILVGDSKNPQHSLDLLVRPGQRAEIICNNSQNVVLTPAAHPGREDRLLGMGFPEGPAVPVLPVSLPRLLVCRFFCRQLHLLALGGLLLCPVTTLSPMPSLFCCYIPPPALFGKGIFLQSISSSCSAFSSCCTWSFLTSSVLWAELWPLLSSAIALASSTGIRGYGLFHWGKGIHY